MTSDSVTITFIDTDIEVRDVDHRAWQECEKICICKYWNGEAAPSARRFAVQTLWSERYLYVRFETKHNHDLVINEDPQIDRKTLGLWERDVCEIFIASDPNEPRKYFEFEVAPTGEWLDLAIDSSSGQRVTDWNYRSGLETFAFIDAMQVTMVLKIPFSGLGLIPERGTKFCGNLFRCVGSGPTRGYLSWRPTMSAQPDFHVPERFGQFVCG